MVRAKILGLFLAFAISGKYIAYTDWYADGATRDGKSYILITATWCEPCQRLKGELKERILPKGIDIVILDVDSEPDAAKKLNPGGMIPKLLEATRKDGKWSFRKWDGRDLEEFFRGK